MAVLGGGAFSYERGAPVAGPPKQLDLGAISPEKADVKAISPKKADVPGDTRGNKPAQKRGKAGGTRKERRVDLGAAEKEDVNGSKGAFNGSKGAPSGATSAHRSASELPEKGGGDLSVRLRR